MSGHRSHPFGWMAALACALALMAPVAYADAAGSDTHAQSVARTVVGILGYTRWPTDVPMLRLCIIGVTEYAGNLLQGAVQNVGIQRLDVQRVRPNDAKALDNCKAIYAGQIDQQVWHGVMQQVEGKPILTISEHSELCRIGAMFCLRPREEGTGFEVNLDSVARSRDLHVNPKVLQLARHRPPSPAS